MKNILLILIIIFIIFGCKEEQIRPDVSSKKPLSITTISLSNITDSSANTGGIIEFIKEDSIISKGVCWSESINPTITGNKTVEDKNSLDFVSILTSLKTNTTYYVRAYLMTNDSIIYGNELSFTTLEKIYNGNVILETQQQVEDFGIHGYTKITGNLTIGRYNEFTASITNLERLTDLKSIGGSIAMYYNDSLSYLTGLDNVAEIGVGLHIMGNHNLLNIDALSKLTKIGSIIYIMANGSINNINSLSGIKQYSNLDVFILNNASLDNITGLKSINTLANLSIEGNKSLTNLDGLNNLTTVSKNLVISYNSSLVNLNSLYNLSTIGRGLHIEYNDSLTSISGLNKLKSIGRLASIGGGWVSGALNIKNNKVLTSLNGLDNLSHIERETIIEKNNLLSDFCALNLLFSSGYMGYFSTFSNGYNPTLDNMLAGNCKR